MLSVVVSVLASINYVTYPLAVVIKELTYDRGGNSFGRVAYVASEAYLIGAVTYTAEVVKSAMVVDPSLLVTIKLFVDNFRPSNSLFILHAVASLLMVAMDTKSSYMVTPSTVVITYVLLFASYDVILSG